MSAYSSVVGVAVVLLHLWATDSFPTSQTCPVPCLCQPGPLLDCSSLRLTRIPVNIPATAISLNISHNALRSLAPLGSGHVKLKGLRHLWVGSNSLESLSLVLKNNWSGTRTRPSGEQECMSWAPDLQLLSAERNHLKHLPRGLHCLKSLQILQLSYNQISEIGPVDLTNSTLKELHLQHNQITNIYSHAFIKLKQLQVVDLSYNLLATISVPAYQSLWNLNALVNISFNRWKCDCNLQTLRRWIGLNTKVGDASWQVVCNSPPHHAGKDLLHLNDSDLTCPTHEYSTSGQYHNMIVDEGMQILISCRNNSQDFMQVHWWTPHGQVKDNQPELLIKDITEQHEGLYICVSGHQGEDISVFDLHVYIKGSGPRPRREAPTLLDEHVGQETSNWPRNNNLKQQRTKTPSDFALAVCLSVIITFIVAFILGVFLRPMLDKLWRRIRSKRHSTPSPTTSRASSLGPQPYVNEGYADDQERDVRVGSRVTFGGVTEVGDQSSNVPYYVTVENVHSDGSSESNTEVEIAYKNKQIKKSSEWRQQALEVDNHRGRASNNSSSSALEGKGNIFITNNKTMAPSSNKVMEFESIPDGDNIIQPKRSSSLSSSSSSSSHSRQTLNRNFSSEVREFIEQSVDPPDVTVSVNETTTKCKIPGFTTEPFTEQNVDNVDTELWNESGESFSFNEESERSSLQDRSGSALGHLINDDDTGKLGNIESLSYKLNFKSHMIDVDKQFGTEVSVDDVKLHKLPDTLSSSSSSESDDSEGLDSYTLKPELEEESEILHGSYRKIDSDRFQTPEDVTFNEKSQPGANILIRQETITLDPSDIHLTLTCEESVDEGMLIDDLQRNSEDVFGSCIDVCLDTVPKVKRYVQFTQSRPHSSTLPSLSPSSTKRNVTSVIDVKSEAKIDTTLGETQITVSPERIRKVKRYINFKPSEPHSPTLPPSPFLTKDSKVETKRYSTSSEEEAKLTSEGDKYSRNIGVFSNEVPKVKRYITFKQIEPSSPTLSVSSPSIKIEATTSSASSIKKDVSGKIPLTEYKKQLHSSNFTPEGLPLYHVHPVYRANQSRVNRNFDIDRTSSPSTSEDEDQFTVYPRKLEIKTDRENIKGSITSDKNTDKVFNIDFDNSSSSTDVFEKKHNKGLTRLKILSTRLFNRRENETDEKNGSTTIPDLFYKSHSNLTEDTVQQTTNEDSFFGHIGLSFDQLKRPKKSILFRISDSQSPNQPLYVPSNNRANVHEEKAEFESRRSSLSSSSDEGSPKHEVNIISGQSSSFNQLPKVKRYLQFPHSDPHSQAQLTSSPPTTRIVTSSLIATTESRKSSSSSVDDVKESTEGEKVYRFPKLKRYIEFSRTDPYSATDHLNKQSISSKVEAPLESRRSSSSSEDDIKPTSKEDNFFETIGVSLGAVPKVERYIKFNQPESYSPTLPSSPISTKKLEVVGTSSSTSINLNVKSDPKEDNYFEQTGVCLDTVPKVKRYVQFTQAKPDSSFPPSWSPSLTKRNVSSEIEVKSEAKVDTSPDTSPNLSPEIIPKVKRYIHFKQSEPHSTSLPPSPSSISKEVRVERSSTSSEDKAKLTTEEDNSSGLFSDGISKVKRYITFKQFEPTSSTLSVSSPSTKTEATTGARIKSMQSSSSSEDDFIPESKEQEFFLDRLPQVKRYLQFKQPVSHLPVVSPTTSLNMLHVTPDNKKLGLRKLSTSSEDSIKLTAQEENFFGRTGAPLDGIPKVKRSILFTQPESQSSTQSTTAQSLSISEVVNETRRSSTSSEEDIIQSTNDDNMNGETVESLVKIPKVKRYIKFTQSEPSLGLSPIPIKSMEGSIPVKSLAMEDNVRLNRLSQTSWSSSSSESTDVLVEQTSLQPQLRKSSYLSSDNRDFFGHVVMDVPPPQNEPPAVPQTPPPPLEQEDAREYLRDNSQVRQRQERRRLLQQRRKAMDDFSITSLSSSPQEGNKPNSTSLLDYGGAYSNVSVVNTVTSRRTEAAEVPALQGLKTKNISELRSKSQVDSANTKYKEFLI